VGTDLPGSRFLGRVTKVAVVVYGIIVAILVIRVLLTPHTYSYLKSIAMENGRTMPPFSSLVEEAIRTLAAQACLFVAPYIVFRSQPVVLAEDDEPSLDGEFDDQSLRMSQNADEGRL
jgi:hypothetical protein